MSRAPIPPHRLAVLLLLRREGLVALFSVLETTANDKSVHHRRSPDRYEISKDGKAFHVLWVAGFRLPLG